MKIMLHHLQFSLSEYTVRATVCASVVRPDVRLERYQTDSLTLSLFFHVFRLQQNLLTLHTAAVC